MLLAAEKKKKAEEEKAAETAEKIKQRKAADEAGAKKAAVDARKKEIQDQEKELQQKHTEDMKAQQDARDKEHELARKAQMSAEQRKLEEQSRAEKDGKKEAELEMKFNKKKSEGKQKAAAAKLQAKQDAIKHREEQQEKKDAAASALADRNAREQAIKDKSKAEAAVREGDDKRKLKINMDKEKEKGEKQAQLIRRGLIKKARLKVKNLKAKFAAQKERRVKDKKTLKKRNRLITRAHHMEKVVKIKKQAADEKAYMAMMNDPGKLIAHLKELTKKWMTTEVESANETEKDEEDPNKLDNMVIDLRQATDQGVADALRLKAKQLYDKRVSDIKTKARFQRRALKLKLQTEAAVTQLKALQNIDLDAAPMIKSALQQFFNAREVIDKVVVLSEQMAKEAEIHKAKQMIIDQNKKKREDEQAEDAKMKKEEESLDPEAAKKLEAERAKDKAAEGEPNPEEMTSEQHFRHMVKKLHTLVGNWDSAVVAPPPAKDAEDGETAANSDDLSGLSAEELAARQAAAQFEAEKNSAIAKEQADIAAGAQNRNSAQGKTPNATPAPTVDLKTQQLAAEGRQLDAEMRAEQNQSPPQEQTSTEVRVLELTDR